MALTWLLLRQLVAALVIVSIIPASFIVFVREIERVRPFDLTAIRWPLIKATVIIPRF